MRPGSTSAKSVKIRRVGLTGTGRIAGSRTPCTRPAKTVLRRPSGCAAPQCNAPPAGTTSCRSSAVAITTPPNAKGPRPGNAGWGPAGQLHEIYVTNVRAAMPSRLRVRHAELKEELPGARDPLRREPVELIPRDRHHNAHAGARPHDRDVLTAPLAGARLARKSARLRATLGEHQPVAGVDPVQDIATARAPRIPRLTDREWSRHRSSFRVFARRHGVRREVRPAPEAPHRVTPSS